MNGTMMTRYNKLWGPLIYDHVFDNAIDALIADDQ